MVAGWLSKWFFGIVHDLDKKIFILIQQKSSIGLYQQIILFWTMIEQPLNLNIQIAEIS